MRSNEKTLRLSKDTAYELSRMRMAVFFPVHPFDIRALPAAVSVVASGMIVALCIWTLDGQLVSPPAERSILVTVLDRDPVLDDPRQPATIPSEPRAAAAPSEVPPPPARLAADPALPALLLRFTRRVDPVAVAPLWVEPAAALEHTLPPPEGGDKGAFWQQVRRLIAARAVYPPAAVRRNASGQVLLRVQIGAHGELIEAGIAESSSDGALDRAALSAVREAAPFPARTFDRGATTNGIEALIPVRFELLDGPAGQ